MQFLRVCNYKANLAARTEPMRRSLLAVRRGMEEYHGPRVREAVAAVLLAQRTDIAQRVREHADAVARKPREAQAWFDARRWDRELSGALSGALSGMALAVSGQVAAALPPPPGKAGPVAGTAVERVLRRGAARVTKINRATRDEVAAILATAVEQEVPLLDVADALEAGTDLTPLIGRSGGVVADLGYRAEMIARTELMDAYNAASLYSYSDAGIEMVQAVDGTGDEECPAREANSPYTVDEADAIEDHPNGTLEWLPVLGDR